MTDNYFKVVKYTIINTIETQEVFPFDSQSRAEYEGALMSARSACKALERKGTGPVRVAVYTDRPSGIGHYIGGGMSTRVGLGGGF